MLEILKKVSIKITQNKFYLITILLLLFISLQLVLNGCGWKFRVLEDKMPFSTIYLSGINNGVGTEIYQRLKRAPGIKIIGNKAEAEVSLTLKYQASFY